MGDEHYAIASRRWLCDLWESIMIAVVSNAIGICNHGSKYGTRLALVRVGMRFVCECCGTAGTAVSFPRAVFREVLRVVVVVEVTTPIEIQIGNGRI